MKTIGQEQNMISVLKELDPSRHIQWQEDFQLISVLSGVISLHIGFEKFILKDGDCMIINSLECNSYTSLKKSTEVLILSMNKETCLKVNPFFYESIAIVDYSVGFAQLQENKDIINKTVFSLVKLLPYEVVGNWANHGSTQLIKARLTDLLNLLTATYRPKIFRNGTLTVAPQKKIDMLYRMIKYLYLQYNRTPSLEDFVQIEHYSLYYMSHVIAEITGTSFREWLTYVRVEQSEKLLLASDLTITAVAYEVGFSSDRYYNANFKKWYGLTPTDYRRLYKNQYMGSPLPTSRGIVPETISTEPKTISQPIPADGEEKEYALTIYPYDVADNRKRFLIPERRCIVSYDEMQNHSRWEHLEWVQRDIGFDTLIVSLPETSNVELESNASSIYRSKTSEQVKQYQKRHGILTGKKIVITDESQHKLQQASMSCFEIMNSVIRLVDVITPNGRKTGLYYYKTLLSIFSQYENVFCTSWNIVGKSSNRITVLLQNSNKASLSKYQDDFTVKFKGIHGEYKVTSYYWDEDLLADDSYIRNKRAENYLTISEIQSLNSMYEPRISVDFLTIEDEKEVKTTVTRNGVCVLDLYSIRSEIPPLHE